MVYFTMVQSRMKHGGTVVEPRFTLVVLSTVQSCVMVVADRAKHALTVTPGPICALPAPH